MRELLVTYATWKLAAPRLKVYYTTQATGYYVFACGDEYFAFAQIVDSADITDFETNFKPSGTEAASKDDAFMRALLAIGVRLTNTQQVPTLEVATWTAFKATCLVGKELLIQYIEYTDAYEVYATDSLVWHIRLARPSADAIDFDTNYKAMANARSNLSVVLVDAAGNVTTSLLGQPAPGSAAMVAFKDNTGNLEAPTVFDLDTGAGKEPTQGVSLRLSASGGSIEAKGQKAMASSIPIVVASDQTAIPVSTAAGSYGGQVEGRAVSGDSPVGNPVYIAGQDGSLIRAIQTDAQGRIVIAPTGSTATIKGFSNGDVVLTTVTTAAVRRTTYTEPTANARRSLGSSNANDSSSGTGARQVRITYLDQTGAGPYTEIVTLNGTTAVNTVATDICFIEKMEVISVGSTGSNAGVITLYASTGGAGGVVGTVAATNNQTFWAHHYVPTGKTCCITGIAAGHNGTVAGSTAMFFAKSRPVGVATAVDLQSSDFLTVAGNQNTLVRNYGTPITVPGPARVTMYVTTSSSSSYTYRASFDYYDQ